MPNVCPSVCFRIYSVIFRPIGLGKVSKDAEFYEVVHSTRNFIIISWEFAENRFRVKFRKFKILHFNPFYECSGVTKVHDYLSFRSFRITERPEFTEYPVFSGKKSGTNYYFFFSVNSISLKVSDVDDSDFCGFW